jgi:hypothetical protein
VQRILDRAAARILREQLDRDEGQGTDDGLSDANNFLAQNGVRRDGPRGVRRDRV